MMIKLLLNGKVLAWRSKKILPPSARADTIFGSRVYSYQNN